jgi:hypothetical protein
MELDTDSNTASPHSTSDIDNGGLDATHGRIQLPSLHVAHSEADSEDTSKTPITGNARTADSISRQSSCADSDADMSSKDPSDTASTKDVDVSSHEDTLNETTDIGGGTNEHSPHANHHASLSFPPHLPAFCWCVNSPLVMIWAPIVGF